MKRKTIALPGSPDENITPIQPIIDTEQFQRLRHIKQLGLRFLVFPEATHTRFMHSLGVHQLTRERTSLLHLARSIDNITRICLDIAGLFHDAGHFPLSHDPEGLCPGNHHTRTLLLIPQIADQICACGGDPELVTQIIAKEHFASCIISHPILGTDKMDYLARDAAHTSESITFRTGDLLNHTFMIDGNLAIDFAAAKSALAYYRSFSAMYDEGYFRHPCLAIRGQFRKIARRELQHGQLTADNLPGMIDDQLTAILLNSKVENVAQLWHNLLFKRGWPRCAVLIAPKNTTIAGHFKEKDITIYRESDETVQALQQHLMPWEINDNMESAIARMLNLNPLEVVIVRGVQPERFQPVDIPVYDNSSYEGGLLELYPMFKESLLEMARSHRCIRVCVPQEHRARVANPKVAGQIKDMLLDAV